MDTTRVILIADNNGVEREFDETKTPYRLVIRRGGEFLFAADGVVFLRDAAGTYVFATC